MSQNVQTSSDPSTISGTATVIVGCKLPHGLVMELGKVGDEKYKRHVLFGANGNSKGAIVAGGFGITTVPADFWEQWTKKNRHLELLKNGAVFAQEGLEDTKAAAVATAGIRTGLEPLNPQAPPKEVTVDTDHINRGRQDLEALGRRVA